MQATLSGDNGPALFLGKCFVHERGIRMPLIVRAPAQCDVRIKPGTVTDELTSSLDLAPTFIDIAGGKVPEYLEGRILLGAKKREEPEFLYAQWDDLDVVTDRVRSAFTKKLKYIRNFTPGISCYEEGHRNVEAVRAAKELYDQGKLPKQHEYYFQPKPAEELYDLERDPFEMVNLVSEEGRMADLRKMRNALDAWLKRTGDSDKPEDPKMIEEMLRLRELERKEEIKNKGKKGAVPVED